MSQETARVIGIYTSPEKGQKGVPMLSQRNVMAMAGIGLEGDRYASGEGAWSHALGKDGQPKVRHVSLIEQEAIAAANDELGEDLAYTAAETRRSLITEHLRLNNLVGEVFWVGKVAMRGTELCDPCKRPEKLTGKPGFEAAFYMRGGLRAEILTNGLIAVGMPITIAEANIPLQPAAPVPIIG